MVQIADAISFVRNRLKYTATKNYVGAISACAINDLWRTINETEMFGMAHNFYCGRITIDSLRGAFLREMSYNPLRFNGVCLTAFGKYEPRTAEIVNVVTYMLRRFESIWPGGIDGMIHIIDTSDAAYVFLRDLRDCFKLIARQNVADFKRSDYRDEIIVRFANATDINMTAAMRVALQNLVAASASRRHARRNITDLAGRISNLEIQINLHRNHDREFCMEMQDELEQLKSLQEYTIASAKKTKRSRKPQNTKPVTQAAFPSSDTQNVIWNDDEEMEYTSEFAEREKELLCSMTPEHSTDEVFRDYVEQMVGIKLGKYGSQNQH